jgi:hypothetical protein
MGVIDASIQHAHAQATDRIHSFKMLRFLLDYFLLDSLFIAAHYYKCKLLED